MVTKQTPEPWFVSATKWFYDGWGFAEFLSATVFGAWASRMTGVTWTTPLGPWLAVAAAVLSGIAGVRIAHFAWRRIRLVLNKPCPVIEIESSGTEKPVLGITHFGAPLTFSAEGRVIRPLSAEAPTVPSLSRFACELHPPEGKESGQQITLRDSEWAQIVLADIVMTQADGQPWLRIRRGSFNHGALADDSGVELEIVVKTEPSWPVGSITRVIRVSRNANRITAVAVGD